MSDTLLLDNLIFWNKVSEDKLTIEMKNDDKRLILRIYTNDVNVLNKKIELADGADAVTDIRIRRILDLAEKVSDNYYGGNYEEFKIASKEMMDKIQLL